MTQLPFNVQKFFFYKIFEKHLFLSKTKPLKSSMNFKMGFYPDLVAALIAIGSITIFSSISLNVQVHLRELSHSILFKVPFPVKKLAP